MGEIELRDGERDVVVHNDGIQKREDDFLSFSFSFCPFCSFFFYYYNLRFSFVVIILCFNWFFKMFDRARSSAKLNVEYKCV